MEKDLYKQFNLPSYIKGKSFAEASKLIEKKFKDRDDKVSNNTKEELLSRLAQAQEYIKMKDAVATNAQEVPDMMEGQIPAGMEQFAEGGFTGNQALGIAQGALTLGQDLFGNTGIDDSGMQQYEQVSEGNSALSGAMSGAQAGMALGPWGAAGGAVIGGIGGLIGANRKNKDINKANNNNAIIENNKYNNDFATGGSLDDIFKINPLAQKTLELGAGYKASQSFRDGNYDIPTKATFNKVNDRSNEIEKTKMGKEIAGAGDWLKDNGGSLLSTAPVLGNAIQLGNLRKPNTQRGQRLDNTYNRNLFDEQSMVNKVNQNDVNSALTQSSGGDLGALRSNILAANLNKTKAISDGMIQGESINRDENRFKFQSDVNRDQANVNLEERYIDRKARDQGAYDTAKSKLTSSLFEDAGKIGQDIVNKKLVKDMYGYSWNGKYYVDPNGNKLSKLQMAQKDKVEKENQAMYGGYLKK